MLRSKSALISVARVGHKAFRVPLAWRRVALWALAACILSGCGPSDEGNDGYRAEPGKIPIRIDLGTYNPGVVPTGLGEKNTVALELKREWEAKHPDHSIVFAILPNVGTSEGEWLKTQLLGGIAPEAVTMNAESAWPDTRKGWFVSVDQHLQAPNPYIPGNKRWIDSFTNQALVNAKRAPDGQLYCISLDVVETGLFYNVDMLKRVGWTGPFPDTWEAMFRLFRILKQNDIVPFAAGQNAVSDWGQDVIFEMIYHSILPQMDVIESDATNRDYLGHYLNSNEAAFLFTKGFFRRNDPRWREVYRLLKAWRHYWSKDLRQTDHIRSFAIEESFCFWGASWDNRRLGVVDFLDFNWDIAYVPRITSRTSRYATGSPATVIGGAATQIHFTNSGVTNETFDKAIDFIQYITTPENSGKLASEVLCYFPIIKGAETSSDLGAFRRIFQREYCAIKWLDSMDGRYKKYWRRMLNLYLDDGVTLDEYLVLIEENMQAWVEHHLERGHWDFQNLEAAWQEKANKPIIDWKF